MNGYNRQNNFSRKNSNRNIDPAIEKLNKKQTSINNQSPNNFKQSINDDLSSEQNNDELEKEELEKEELSQPGIDDDENHNIESTEQSSSNASGLIGMLASGVLGKSGGKVSDEAKKTAKKAIRRKILLAIGSSLSFLLPIIIIILLAIALLMILGIFTSKSSAYSNTNYSGYMNKISILDENGMSREMNFEDYIAGVVFAESGGLNFEVQKAQAVVARTYAIKVTENGKKAIRNSESDQVYKTPSSMSLLAAKETKGEILTSTNADGKEEVFLAQYSSYPRQGYNSGIGICSVTTSNDGSQVTTTLYKQPSNTPQEFTIPTSNLRKSAHTELDFTSKYFGHCNGMSQWIADYYASQGKTYIEILNMFYDGNISKMSTMVPPVELNGGNYEYGSPFADLSSIRSSSHTGWDLRYPVGTETRAVADGTVLIAISGCPNCFCGGQSGCTCNKCGGSYGNYIKIGHDVDGDNNYDFYTLYAHHTNIFVTAGQKVYAGQKIGEVGSSGNSSGYHLHFEFCHSEQCYRTGAVNPQPFLDALKNGNGDEYIQKFLSNGHNPCVEGLGINEEYIAYCQRTR